MFCTIEGIKIPLVMTGSSTFVGSAQFGKNARIYRKKFLKNTEAMLEILKASYQAGGRGFHVVDAGKIVEAAKIMLETHNDYVVIGSTFPGPDPLIENLIAIRAKIIFIHASAADRKDQRLNALIEEISSRGVHIGLAVHNAISTLTYAFENLPDIKTFLTPFNKAGLYMGYKEQLEQLIDQKKDCFFIGMKTMAAGKLNPEEAFDYISKHNICAATIGMVTLEEATITTKMALEMFSKK
ncbi:MAG: hypothetical protein ACTSU4_12780 [Promethearchaeota archaeon]